LKASFGGWSDDLKHFYVLTSERDPKFFDCYRYDAGTDERTLLYKTTGGFGQPAGARDGRNVALLKTRTNADNDVYLWDAGWPDAEPVKVTPHEGDAEHAIETFSPGGCGASRRCSTPGTSASLCWSSRGRTTRGS
jgi:prolyl oligopeptidase